MGKISLDSLRLFTRRAKDPIGSFNVAKLSNPEVSSFLSANEHSHTVSEPSAVKGYVTNQLAANEPLEDTRAEAKFLHKNGMMFGVYDGHGGASCARVLAKRLFNYIAVSLLNLENRKKFENDENFKIIEQIHDLFEWRENRVDVYNRCMKQWAGSLGTSKMGVPEAIKKAFERLDGDIGKAAEEDKNLSLGVAMSGAVACVAVVSDVDLHVASAGDCQAVLGQQSGGAWVAKKLTTEHTCDNEKEVARIKNEHPPSERLTLIKEGRLFQSLVPLRSFGDYRYKWTVEQLEKFAVPKYGRGVIPPNYSTPPYLTATPDITSVKLTEKDKFLVIGSDGLWDVLSPQMVVQLVGDHMTGKSSILQLQLHKFKDLFPGKDSKEARELRPVDKSAATHLIRAALGGDHEVVSKQLSFPMEHVRIIRDDMTVTVIYFNSDFITSYPNIKEKDIIRNTDVTEEVKDEKTTEANSKPDLKESPKKFKYEKNKANNKENKKAVWEGIEADEKQVSFDLDRAVEEGGYTYKAQKFKIKAKTNVIEKVRKAHKVTESGHFKKMQIFSLRNQSLKEDNLKGNYGKIKEDKDVDKVKVKLTRGKD